MIKKDNLGALNLKNRANQVLGLQYMILATFWLIFIALLITAIVLFTTERANINSANNVDGILNQIATGDLTDAQKTELYKQLLDIRYPLIDFALMNFIQFGNNSPIADWAAAWTQRVNDVNIAYSYIFITALIAIIGFCFYGFVIYRIYARRRFERRYGLANNFPNDYAIYDSKMFLDFTISLAIVFSFFNFLTTIIAVIYGAILVTISYFFWYILKIKDETLVRHKWWTSPNFILFLSILVIQNGYNFLKVEFAIQFGVNLDLILTILFPIGTITIMITLLIRNMLNTKVSAVRKAIKTIGARISSFRIFYYSQKEKTLEDYTFITQLPTLIRVPLEHNNITDKEAYQLMTLINDTAKFFELHFIKPKERNYMLFHLFNNITNVAEINEIKENALKVEAQRKK